MRIVLYFIAIIICQQVLKAQNNEYLTIESKTDSLYSETLKSYRDYWIKLPDNYNPKSEAKYPVIYLLDGFSLKENLEVVYNNYWGHYLPPMILVGVSNRTNRTRDLTISKVETRRGAAMQAETGGAEEFTKFLKDELMPYIDKAYPTTSYRTLIGHSYAGLFTIYTLLNNSELFTNYLAIDPSIEWDNQKLLADAKEKFKKDNFQEKSLFVALAAEQLHMQDESVTIENVINDESEFSQFSRTIIDFLEFAISQKQNKLNFNWKVYPEDIHGTVPLPAMIDGLVTMFKWFQFKSPQKYNNPKTSIDEIRVLLNNQEVIYTEHFGYKVPPMVEELFNGYGYMNLQMEQPEKAFLFFDMAIKYYPKSANSYDGMADYYIYKKDDKKAIEYLKKAYDISGSDYLNNKLNNLKE